MPKKGISQKTRTIITIILLLLTIVYPLIGLVGIIIMWVWTKWNSWLKVLITIPIALFAVTILLGVTFLTSYSFLVKPYRANGMAMAPTYKNGAYIWTTPYNPKTIIKRGDIIVFRAPNNPEKDFIKRVIALPMETLTLNNGDVIINDQKLDELGYLEQKTNTLPGNFLADEQTLTIPSKHYFVMGDNRIKSSDSREWGFVPQDNIVSIAKFCYWNCK